MNIAAYILAVIALIIAADNRQSIIEMRAYYNKLYKDNVYGKSVTIEDNKLGLEVTHEQ